MEPARIEKNHCTCLIGNIVSDRVFDRFYIECITQRMWLCNVRVTEIKSNCFVFYFDKNDDCYRVLRDTPWKLQDTGVLLILSPLFSGNNNNNIIPYELPFCYWVQVHGLPNYSFTEQNAFKIGQFLGEYLYVDKTVWGKFMRIRVRLDIRNPLVAGFWLMSNIWIPFKYENLGLFCYECGRIGNHQHTCKFPPGNQRFGPWLRVENSGVRGIMEENNSMIVVKKPSENFTLIPSPNLLASPEVEHDLENTTPPMNDWARLTINGVDSMIMMVNCVTIACRVGEANEVKGYGWLIVMMATYFFYLMLKFNVMVRRIGFFQKSISNGGSSMVEYTQVAQLKDLLILLMFCVVFLLSC